VRCTPVYGRRARPISEEASGLDEVFVQSNDGQRVLLREAPRPREHPHGQWAELGSDALGLKEVVRKVAEDAERRVLKTVLDQVCWRRVEAAQLLRISYKTLLEKIKYYELDRRPAEPAPAAPPRFVGRR
jgi:DNA-binding NtrC family response regulator